MLDFVDVADLLGVSERTAYRWKRAGRFPPHVEVERRHLWRSEDVRAWLLTPVDDTGVTWGGLLKLDDADWRAMEAQTRADPTAADWATDRGASAGEVDVVLGTMRASHRAEEAEFDASLEKMRASHRAEEAELVALIGRLLPGGEQAGG